VTSPSDVVTRWGVVKPSRPGRPLSASPARRANPVLRSGQPRRNIVRIADGDTFVGEVDGQLVARAVREALRRSEAENKRFSLGAATLPTGASAFSWDDEFLKLNGPEVARFMTPGTTVPVDWVREWARGLDGQAVLLSNHIVVDLPTRAAAAAAATVSEQLPTGARIRFLATGVEFVGEDETNRVKGDFDGAIDVLVEPNRVRVVRAEMEPIWRRTVKGGRKQVAPLVKVTSESRLLERLAADLRGNFTCVAVV